MSYQVLARKWRPRDFGQVIGQQHVVRALQNALKLGRLHHAYLFTGTRGVGKTTLARILAKCFNCEQGVSAAPCGDCAACRQVDGGNFMDLIEIDAASRTGVDDMRELLDNAHYAAGAGRYKIYLIDEVHMLSVNSFNALLKTLEEPPEHVKFFFATTHPQKIPVTILSRCLQFNLTRLPHALIREHLAKLLAAEDVPCEDTALDEIAVAAEGSVRDALSLLDQAIAYGDGRLRADEVETMLGLAARQQVMDLGRCIADGDAARLFEIIELAYRKAVDFESLLKDVIALLHQVALRQALPGAEISPQLKGQEVDELAAAVTAEDLQLCYQIAINGKRDMAFAADDKAAFEMTMLRMLHFTPLPTSVQPRRDGGAQAAAAAATPAQAAPQTRRAPPPPAPPKDATPKDAPPKEASPRRETPYRDAPQAAPPNSESEGESEARAAAGFRLTDCGDVPGWMRLIEASGLQGAAKEICLHSLLTPQSASAATLAVDERIETLCSDERKREIGQALSRLIGAEVSLAFETASAAQTPAQMKMREKLERHREAELAIEKNPQVHSLKERFNARTVPDSTRPIEPQS